MWLKSPATSCSSHISLSQWFTFSHFAEPLATPFISQTYLGWQKSTWSYSFGTFWKSDGILFSSTGNESWQPMTFTGNKKCIHSETQLLFFDVRVYSRCVCKPRHMGWLRLVGSLKLQVSFAEYSLFYRALLIKRSIVIGSLRIEATPYLTHWALADISVFVHDAWITV